MINHSLHEHTSCDRKPIIHENLSENKSKLRKFDNFSNWSKSDYNYKTGFNIEDYSRKNYFYNSDLALKGTLYNLPGRKSDYLPDYFVRSAALQYYPPHKRHSSSQKMRGKKGRGTRKSGSKHENTVPGPFPYNWPWSRWGGDEKYNLGPEFTSAIIGHFGHTHILTLHNKINAIRANKNANVLSQTKVLDHLLYASSQIFRRFAGLIDLKAAPIRFDPAKPSGQLKMMMEMMIIGEGTRDKECKCPTCKTTESKCLSGLTCCCATGILDTNMIITRFREMAEGLALDEKCKKDLMYYVNYLNKFMTDMLLLNDKEKSIHLLAWYQLLSMHQKDMFEAYVLYRKYYENPTEENKAKLNASVLMGVNGGRQLGCFFGVIYVIIAFLDTLLQHHAEARGVKNVDTAIPPEYRKDRLDIICYIQGRQWMEHTTMFDDYCKAAARDDDETMYIVEVQMLESCTVVGISVGEIFRAFDKLIRKLNFYDNFDKIYMNMMKKRGQ